jgi:hypothetical protein
MIKIITNDSLEIYLSRDSIKEIVVVPNSDEIIIHTETKRVTTGKSELERILGELQDYSTGRLAKAIRDLTTLLRARMH